jgi:hypothetical protein
MTRLSALVSAIAAVAMGVSWMSGAMVASAQASPQPVASAGAAVDQLLTGYLATSLLDAVFLQWASDGAALTGTFTEASLDGFGATSRDLRNLPISGTFADGSVTLTVGDTLSGSTRWSGVLTPLGLIMGIPSSSGSIVTTIFVPGSVADYNAAVARLGAIAAESQRLAHIEAQRAALRSAVATQVLVRPDLVIRGTTAPPGSWGNATRARVTWWCR